MPITAYGLDNAAALNILPNRFEHLENKLKSWINDGTSQSITVRTLKNGREIFTGSYGVASPGGPPLSDDAIFPIASITKPIVAALLLQLQEDGEVDFFRPVADYLPEFGENGKNDICVHHLLTHTSGLEDDTFNEDIKKYAAEKFGMTPPPEDCGWVEMEKFAGELCAKIGIDHGEHDVFEKLGFYLPAKNKPGTIMSYNSFAYDVALKIALRITGEGADALASRRLFNPLGMTDSHFILPEEKHGRLVLRGEGYNGYPWFNECFDWDNGGSGLKSTTADILKFMEMIRLGGVFNGERVLSPLSAGLMTENQNRHLDSFSSWTIGFNRYGGKLNDTGMLRSPHTIDHGGAMQCYVRADMDNELSFAYFSIMRDGTPLRRPLVANMVMSALNR